MTTRLNATIRPAMPAVPTGAPHDLATEAWDIITHDTIGHNVLDSRDYFDDKDQPTILIEDGPDSDDAATYLDIVSRVTNLLGDTLPEITNWGTNESGHVTITDATGTTHTIDPFDLTGEWAGPRFDYDELVLAVAVGLLLLVRGGKRVALDGLRAALARCVAAGIEDYVMLREVTIAAGIDVAYMGRSQIEETLDREFSDDEWERVHREIAADPHTLDVVLLQDCDWATGEPVRLWADGIVRRAGVLLD